MKHIISVLVENKFGVLARISGLFSARGFNIDSLAVGETEDPSISRMTIVVKGDDRILEQIIKQLRRLMDVIKVMDLTKKDYIDRELLLFKVDGGKKKEDVSKILKKYKAIIIEEKEGKFTVEAANSKEQVEKLLEELSGYQIKEMVRTGRIAMEK
ncbi:MAG: acetolactate synthase small subunit [Candidatus Omnitrophota bacterium]